MSLLSPLFKDLKIVELASVLAGPLAGSFFAELGATVYKIENKKAGGDVTRTWKLPEESNQNSTSAYYHSANYRKHILHLDLTDTADLQALNVLISDADIILTNYQKLTAQKLSIDTENLKMINGNAVIIQLNAFDYDDARPGYDLVMQAETGYISMCGDGEILAKMPVAMIDILASHQMKESALIGLLYRQKYSTGCIIHVSLYKSAISGLINQATNYLMENHVAQPIGTRHPNIAPYGEIITTSDGIKIMLAIGSDGQFEKLLKILYLEQKGIFKHNLLRLQHRKELSNYINQSSIHLHSSILINALNEHNIPYALIKNIEAVFNDNLAQSCVLPNDIEGRKGFHISGIAFELKNPLL